MEYRNNTVQGAESQEVRGSQNSVQENSQGSSASAWQSAAQDNSQNGSAGAWQSAAQGSSQSGSADAWQSAPQSSGQASGQNQDFAWGAQHAAQESTQQADAQAQTHHTTGGWAPRRPEFHHNAHQKPEHAKRSGRSMAGKIAGVTAAAVLFGTVAGGTMFAVNTTGEYLKG